MINVTFLPVKRYTWRTGLNRVEEKRLIQAASKGDSQAFAALYRANVQAIYRYIYYRVSDAHVAEDLTADVFTKALKAIRTYKDSGKPLIAWLYRIAHARVVDHYRKTERRPDQVDIEKLSVSESADMDNRLLRQQTAKALRLAISQLTADQQQVIILRFIEDKRLEEVAQLMGKNVNAIKALQHRALRSLAVRLERAGFKIDEFIAGLL